MRPASARRGGPATAGTSAACAPRPGPPTSGSPASTCSPPAAPAGTDEAFALALPEATTASMAVVLAHFAHQLGPGVHAAPVLDRAGWHVARRLAAPANITLVPLPPYSPELNPVERVWLYLRERFLSHRVLDGLRGRARGRLPGVERPRRRDRPARQPHRLPLPAQVRTWVS